MVLQCYYPFYYFFITCPAIFFRCIRGTTFFCKIWKNTIWGKLQFVSKSRIDDFSYIPRFLKPLFENANTKNSNLTVQSLWKCYQNANRKLQTLKIERYLQSPNSWSHKSHIPSLWTLQTSSRCENLMVALKFENLKSF